MPVACTIEGLFAGNLLVTPEKARELANKGIIQASKILGHFTLVDEEEDALWRELRKRTW